MSMAPNVSVLLPDLRPGGAERLHVQLANDWVSKGLAVEFVLRQKRGELLREVDPRISVVSLDAPRVRASVLPLMKYILQRKPDSFLAAMWPLTVIAPLVASICGYQGRVVVGEHAPLSMAYASRGRVHRAALRGSIRSLYPRAHARIVVSEGVASDLARLSGIAKEKFSVIYNPAARGRLFRRENTPRPSEFAGCRLILSIGTLKPVKRHDLLIRALAKINRKDVMLVIAGEGSERARLEALARELGVDDRVRLPGYIPDPLPLLGHADLFVLTSNYEGFGNVLVEALEQGTPVVSTDCPFGPREILDNGKYGTMVPVGDVDAIAAAIVRSLSSEHDRFALMRRASDFSLSRASAAYLDLLLPDWRGRIT